MRGLTVIAALVACPFAATFAAPITVPSCDILNPWAFHIVSNDTFNVAPQLVLPKAFQDATLVPLFGAPVLTWSQEDVQAASLGLTQCYQDAVKLRDQTLAGTLANANRTLMGILPRTLAISRKAKTDADALKQQLDAMPDSVDLSRGIEILVNGNPAVPDANAFRALPREISEPVWRLAQVAMTLGEGDREPLFKALADRGRVMRANIIAEAEKAIAAAPEDGGGVVTITEIRQRAGAMSDPGAKVRLIKAADGRAQNIRDALRHAKPAAWIPPSCIDLYRWSGAPGGTAAEALARRVIPAALLDDRVTPVFGLSLSDWSDQDIARFKSLRMVCRTASQWRAGLRPDGPEMELIQIANRGRWIEDADQQIADGKATVVAYHTARRDLATAQARVLALPDVTGSIAILASDANDPNLAAVTQQERVAFANAINQKRAAIGAHATDAALKGLAGTKVNSMADLAKFLAFASQAFDAIPDPQGQQAFRTEFDRRLGEATARLLPQLTSQLAALPASVDGLAQINGTMAALGDGGRLAPFKPFYDAAHARFDAIVRSVHAQACADLLASLNMGSDAKQDLWDGDTGLSLGDFICGLAEHGYTINSYAGTGVFSGTSTLKVTPIQKSIEIISLHKAETRTGKSMLVGYKIVDANGRPSSVAGTVGDAALPVSGWETYARSAKGNGPMEGEACKAIKDAAPAKLAPGQKLFWLHCGTLPFLMKAVAADGK